MAELKTKPTDIDVEDYLAAIPDQQRRDDCRTLVQIMSKVTHCPPVMWGAGIVGFGQYHYKYASGHAGDTCVTGFASRKGDISIYTQVGFDGREELLASLGKHKAGKGCLYVRKLADVDALVLEKIIAASVADVQKRYPAN